MKRTIYWASKQLRKGKKVRRKQWIDEAYLFLDNLGDIRSSWTNKRDHTEPRDLCIEDIEAEDWELK